MSKHDNNEIPLLQYLDSLVENLRKLMSAAISGDDVDAVHDARVITRRLKAATNLVKTVVSGRCRRPFDRVGKSLRRQLGPLRDLDVMLEHLDEFKQPKLQPAVQWMRECPRHPPARNGPNRGQQNAPRPHARPSRFMVGPPARHRKLPRFHRRIARPIRPPSARRFHRTGPGSDRHPSKRSPSASHRR